MKFIVVRLLQAVILLTPCALGYASPDPIKVVVIGDRTGGYRPGVFEATIDAVNSEAPDLVLSVGDLIEGYVNDRALINAQWQEEDRQLRRIDAPLFVTPGNHDISNALMHEIWLERYGHTYFSKRIGRLHLLVMSTEDPPIHLSEADMAGQRRLEAALAKDPLGAQQMILQAYKQRGDVKLPGNAAVSSEQLAWALGAIQTNSDAQWHIVVMHKPIWRYAPEIYDQLVLALPDNSWILAGHEHYFADESDQKQKKMMMGTSGGIWLKDGPGRLDHIVIIDLKSGSYRSRPITSEYDSIK